MKNLTVKQGENGKYGFVDDAGNWVIEPKFLDAYLWGELAIVHFEKVDEDGDPFDGWTFFKVGNPTENPEEDGWFDHIRPSDESDEYLDAWNECGDSSRIYPDGKVLDDDEFEDDEDWDDDDE